jgi:hypothetical protein
MLNKTIHKINRNTTLMVDLWHHRGQFTMSKNNMLAIHAFPLSLWLITSIWIFHGLRCSDRTGDSNIHSDNKMGLALDHPNNDCSYADLFNSSPDLMQLNLSRPKDYAVWWLETRGIFTGFSSPMDMKRQLAFRLGKDPENKKRTYHFRDMTLKELCHFLFQKRLHRKRSHASLEFNYIPPHLICNDAGVMSRLSVVMYVFACMSVLLWLICI